VITSIISAFAYLLTGQWGKAWQAVLNIFKNIGGMLVSVVGSVINGILSIISSLIGLVGGIFSSMWSGALNITGKLLGGISDKITSFCSQAASWGANLINEFISGIRSRIQGVINAVSDVVGSVKDFLGFSSPTKKGPGSYADQWAPNFMEMFIGGIQAGIPAMKSIALKSVSQLSVMGQSQTASELSLAGSDQSAPMIRIDQMHVRNDQDIRLISQELWRLHQRQARSFGGNV
jgi:phage-related protein